MTVRGLTLSGASAAAGAVEDVDRPALHRGRRVFAGLQILNEYNGRDQRVLQDARRGTEEAYAHRPVRSVGRRRRRLVRRGVEDSGVVVDKSPLATVIDLEVIVVADTPVKARPRIGGQVALTWAVGRGLGAACTERQTGDTQTARHQHSRCYPDDSSFHGVGGIHGLFSFCSSRPSPAYCVVCAWRSGRTSGICPISCDVSGHRPHGYRSQDRPVALTATGVVGQFVIVERAAVRHGPPHRHASMLCMTSDQPWWFTMPPKDVAATILPLFSYPQFSPCAEEELAVSNIISWCKTGSLPAQRKLFRVVGRKKTFEDPDTRAIAEAIQVLEHARLLIREVAGSDVTDCYLGLTRLGMHAVATNTVRQHLGLGDTPPTTS